MFQYKIQILKTGPYNIKLSMGNGVCSQSNKKLHKMITKIINNEFDQHKKTNDQDVDNLISYLENNSKKISKTGLYTNIKLKEGVYNYKNSPQDIYLQLIANSFQLYKFIFEKIPEFKDRKMTIKQKQMNNSKMKRFGEKKSIKFTQMSQRIDPTFLTNFLKYQKKFFTCINQNLNPLFENIDFTQKYVRNILYEILQCWNQILKIWFNHNFMYYNIDGQFAFKTCCEHSLKLGQEKIILEQYFYICHIIPLKLFKFARDEILTLIEKAIQSPQKNISMKGAKILINLLKQIQNSKDYDLLRQVLVYFFANQIEIIQILNMNIQDENLEKVEEIEADIFLKQVREKKDLFPVFCNFLKNSQSEWLQRYLLQEGIQFIIYIFKNEDYEEEERQVFFNNFAKNTTQNRYFGITSFISILFLQIKSDEILIKKILRPLEDFLDEDIRMNSYDEINQNFVDIFFDIIDINYKYLLVFEMLIYQIVEEQLFAVEVASKLVLQKLKELNVYFRPNESEHDFEKYYLSISLGTAIGFLNKENELFLKSSFLDYMIFLFEQSDNFLSYYICLVLLTNFLEDFVGFKDDDNINKLRQILFRYENSLKGQQIPSFQNRQQRSNGFYYFLQNWQSQKKIKFNQKEKDIILTILKSEQYQTSSQNEKLVSDREIKEYRPEKETSLPPSFAQSFQTDTNISQNLQKSFHELFASDLRKRKFLQEHNKNFEIQIQLILN